MEHLTDQVIYAGCISGDRHSQEAFVRRFSNLVYRSIQYTLRIRDISCSQSDLEDLHNTVFVKLFDRKCKKLRQFKGKNGCSLSSWIRLISVRTVLDSVRKGRTDALTRKNSVLSLDALADMKSEAPEPLTVMNKGEQSRMIRKGLLSLLPRDRLFLKLHCLRGLSIREVAVILRISEGNAHSLKHRAIKRLRAQIEANIKDTA
jgi:RNA polymerase sigma factor (sigma-70 family)